jgi:rhamnosyl/mannosyltransferase
MRYDVVNVHGPVPTMSEVFLLLMRTVVARQRPAIVYTHHCDIAIPRLTLPCRFYNFIAGRIAHSADRIVVSTEHYQDKLLNAGKTSVDLIPWAVEVAAARTATGARSTDSRDSDDLRVLFVGQLREYKGVNVLLDAVEQQEKLQISIVGDGPLRQQINNRIAAGGLDHVSMKGRLSDAELSDAYRQHDVIVLPSTTTAEAYGLVLAEGMVAGCVPVASDLPGVREVAAATGIVVPPSDPGELRAALRSLQAEPATLQRLAKASLKRAEGFDIPRMALRYEQSFRCAVRQTQAQQRVKALPDLWNDPENFFAELSALLGLNNPFFSLAVLDKKNDTHARVWTPASHAVRTQAPLVRYVAKTSQPLLLADSSNAPEHLRQYMTRPEIGSALVVPVQRQRRSASVLSVSTRVDHDTHLDQNHLEIVLRVLEGAKVRPLVAA